jgi:hypothetical protein
LSATDQRRLIEGVLHANDLVSALDNGGEYLGALAAYKRVAMGLGRVQRCVDTVGPEADGSLTSMANTLERVSGQAAMEAPAVAQGKSPVSLPSLSILKAGDWSGLVNKVGDSCGGSIKSVFEGLAPQLMADVFANFGQKLAQRFCVAEDVVIIVTAAVSRNLAEKSRAA